MSPPISPPTPDVAPPPGRSSRPLRGLFVLAAVLGTLVVVGVASLVFLHGNRAVPAFPSLAEHPDRTLHGTVAYLAAGNCIDVVAAGGGPSK